MLRRAGVKAALVAVTVLVAAGPLSGFGHPALAATSNESALLGKINALRQSKGLSPLQLNGPLSSFAAGWTSHLVAAKTLAHNPNLASAPNAWTVLGENVGDGVSVDSIFDGFVASSHHYTNMVDPRFNVVGISVQVDDSGRVWTTNDFEQLPSTTSAPAAPAPRPAAATPPAPAAPSGPASAPHPSSPAPRPSPMPVGPPPTTPAAATASAPVGAPPAVAAAAVPRAPAAPVPSRFDFSLEQLRGAAPGL